MRHDLILYQFPVCGGGIFLCAYLFFSNSYFIGQEHNMKSTTLTDFVVETGGKLKPWHMPTRVLPQRHTLQPKTLNNSKVDKMALLTIGISDWHLLIFHLPSLGPTICCSCFHAWYDFTFLSKLEPCRRNSASVTSLFHLALCHQGSPVFI